MEVIEEREEREKINKDFEMVSPFNKIGVYPYVNVFGDSVMRIESRAPIMFTSEESEQFVDDIVKMGIRVQMGEKLTFFEKTMLGVLRESGA